MWQAVVGRLYYHGGHGVQRNYTKALSYFKKAAGAVERSFVRPPG
jgi:TPR repeat protein